MPLNLKGDHQERENLVDLGYYVHLVKSRLTSIVCFTILCTAIAVLIVLSTTPTYTATSTLLIESSQKKAISIEEVVGIDTTAKEYYLTQFEILKSNQVSKRVIEKLNLVENPEFNSKLNDTSTSLFDDWKAIAMNIKVIASFIGSPDDVELDQNATDVAYRRVLKEFKSRLTISPIRKTQLVNISFESEDPELAAIIANEVGQAFIENSLESKLVANEQATSWINQRLTELKQQLDRSERALLDFLERQELIDDSGIIALTSSELSNLTERIARASDKRIETQALYNALKGNKNVDVSTLASISLISNHPQIRDIRQAESDAAKIVSELSKRYGPKHDKMIQANAQLKSIQNRASSLILKLINGIEKELTSAINQEKLLKNELSSKKEEFQALSVVKREYDSLKREVDTNAKLYDLFLTRQKETSATSDFSSANARFSDYALVPESPSKPNKKLVVLISFFVSTGLAIALVVIQDALNKTIENARDLKTSCVCFQLAACQ
ncbi:GumC family protein [Vibrio europaeus]|uniref:GumC family protein n=1 Tax=Vibrio europaeus TaxID=300876 RepID=UPI00233F44A9|nr:GumC family protein [Vibrio europaeus]MDC5817868.1 GumC family protein [Vibrio europaeus]